ncbi:MAG: DUF512 domain-containing protein [Lachnospiraceae bacterium]|nr:DUF512 domain-containing protein [Lachnospiraceae bacterium]
MKQQPKHIIKNIIEGSIAEELELEAGDELVEINGERITDIFDYQFLVESEYLEILIRKSDGEEWLLEVDKDEDEDLGIEFENGFMDDYRSCHNKCIFCFIDQMPKGMRETLYFKDDDSRLSFLQGNYITLTNMSEEDIDRVIRYHLSPINISFQTMNPKLRCKMLNNRFAGEALKKVDRFMEAGITMNGQIVLCKGVNDGKELDYSIRKMTEYIPNLESVSVVPVGLSKYREGLYPLEPFTKEDAIEVLDIIHGWQDKIYKEHGIHFVHASDEWYILAGRDMPSADNYDGYLQLENGVGMIRLLKDEFTEAMEELEQERKKLSGSERKVLKKQRVSIATAKLAYPCIRDMAEHMMKVCEELEIMVYEITNHFFGEMITVSGLLTGQDLIAQLKERDLGDRLLLPENVLRSGEEVFLDDVTLTDMKMALQVPIDIVKSSGQSFVDTVLGL